MAYRKRFEIRDCINWNTAFNNYRFTNRQLELIKNFNIKYECLDARDDYRTQLKKDAGILSTWEESTSNAWEDIAAADPYASQSRHNDDDIPSYFLQLGKGEMKRQREMLTMRNIMNNLGWTTESQDMMLHNNPDLQFPPITNNRSSAEWKNEVAKKTARGFGTAKAKYIY